MDVVHYMTTNGIGNAWVGNELRVLQREGIEFELHSLMRPESSYFEASEIEDLARATHHVYPVSPLRMTVSFLIAPVLFGTSFWSAFGNALFGERESAFLRLKVLWHFLVACDWARSIRKRHVTLIHSQWVNSGGTVALYGAWLLDRPFSFTGHAADLFRGRVALHDKISRAENIVCISEFHRSFFLEHGARPEQLRLAYCGIDTTRFSLPAEPRKDDGTFHVLSSGRLVEKKGFEYVIEACRILVDRGVRIRCTIAGSGPLESSLRQQVRDVGLDGMVIVTGEAMMQEQIPEIMHSADVYCLPCVWASDDDVDGLPQMLMEAMACGLPVVSSRLVGIPDLVIDGSTGLLTDPRDATGLADCLQRMHDDPPLAARLALAGREHVVENFDLRDCLDPLIDYYRSRLEAK